MEETQAEPKTEPSLLETVTRLEKANAEMKSLLERQENLIARNLLGGITNNATPQQPKEETAKEYAKRISSGKL